MKTLNKKIVKQISRLLLVAFAFTLVGTNGIAASAANNASVSYKVTGELKKGNTVKVEVNVANANKLYGSSFDFTYDSSLIKVKSIKQGSIYSGKASEPVKNLSTGKVEFAATLTGANSVAAKSGSIAVMEVQILKDAGAVTFKTTNQNTALSANGTNCRVKLASASSDAGIAYTATAGKMSWGGNNPDDNVSVLNSFVANKSSVLVGEKITFTANATPSADTLYEFYIYENNRWVRKQAFSSNNKLTYSTTKPGQYQARVFIKHKNASASQGSSTIKFTVTTSSETTSKVTSITPNNKVGRVGVTTQFTANATPAADTLYEFYVNESGTWERIQRFSNNATINYTPKKVGAFKVRVFVRHVNSPSKTNGYVDLTYTVVNSNDPISSLSSFTVNKTTSNVGDRLTFTAVGSPSNDTLYEFYIYENGKWVRKQKFSNKSTFTYTPSKAGNYQARVFAKHKNADKASDQLTVSFTVK